MPTNICLFPLLGGTMICWRCRAAYDDHMPYWGFSIRCPMEDQEAQTWNLLQGPDDCKSNCQHHCSLALVSHFGHGMHWHDALCGLGGSPRCEKSLVERSERLVHKTQSHKAIYRLWVYGVMVQLLLSIPKQQRQSD